MAEALKQMTLLRALSFQECDLLGIFTHAEQVEAEVGLVALFLKIEIDERRADPMSQRGAQQRVGKRAPDQKTRDDEIGAVNVQRRLVGQAPEDDDE